MVRVPLLALLIALPAMASTAPTDPKAASAKAAVAKPAVPLTQGTRRAPLSAEGLEIAKRISGTPDPRVAQIQAELASLRQDKIATASSANADLDKLEATLKREDVLLAELRSINNARLIALLRALPPADRATVLQTLSNPAKPQNANAAPTR